MDSCHGTVGPGATATITLVVRSMAAGALTDSAAVTGDLFDPDAFNIAIATIRLNEPRSITSSRED
jgi:hypothetical protein